MKAGDIINWEGKKYHVEEARDDEHPCEGCAFRRDVPCNCTDSPMCISSEDGDPLIFVELQNEDNE